MARHALGSPSARPRPGSAVPGTTQTGPRSPRIAPESTERRGPQWDALVSPADALALSSWAALMAARDRLSQGQVRSILHACREWRQCLRDAGILEQFEALKASVAKLTAAKAA